MLPCVAGIPLSGFRQRLAQVSRFVLVFGWLLASGAGNETHGQLPDGPEYVPAERERLFDEIAREAVAIERQSVLLKKVIRYARPSVVHIDSAKSGDGKSNSRKTVEETGAGVIVLLNGSHYVLTNRHVVADAELKDISIKFDNGRVIHPDRVWSHVGTDIGVLAVSGPGVVPARIGDSNKAEIGDFVLAIGSPFGLNHSVTFGMISATGRRDLQLGTDGVRYQDFLQTDAAINPGNSGGPLLNVRGEVVGLNTAIASNTGGNDGIGFAIPINMAMFVARQLVTTGKVIRSYLGVQLESKFSAEKAVELGMSRVDGALVNAITPGSPAEKAGMLVRDVILRFDGIRIEDDVHLVNRVSFTPIGREADVTVFRQGKLVQLRTIVDDRTKYENEKLNE